MNTFATFAVLLCWPVYLFLFIKKGALRPEHRRHSRLSAFGILLQAVSVFLMFYFRRTMFTPILAAVPIVFVAPVVAMILAAGAVWFSYISLKVLGEQWAFLAGVKAEHRLVQTGPYSIIRHPLYICFFALVLATGMVWTTFSALAVAMGLFVVGMWVRIRTEEKLLRDVFSSEFDDYARRVPSVVPWPSSGTSASSRPPTRPTPPNPEK
jgi:protein-S-isoprenylcysteine O-methyltransferase Ste14